MSKSFSIVLVLIVATACSGKNSPTEPTIPPAPTAPAQPAPQTYTITGDVAEPLVGTDSKPIAGAAVRVSSGPDDGKTTTTDSQGRFTLSGLQPTDRMPANIIVSADGYAPEIRQVAIRSDLTLSFRLKLTSSFEVNGFVRDDAGTPLPNVRVELDYPISVLEAPSGAGRLIVSTNETGFFALPFNSAADFDRLSEHTLLSVYPPFDQYDADLRWLTIRSNRVSQDVRLYRVRPITAGESTDVTVTPQDSICLNNMQDMPWRDWDLLCRTVHIIAPDDGVLTVEAVSLQGGARPQLEVEVRSPSSPCCLERIENPTSLAVRAGTHVIANVEIPLKSTTSQTFRLNTALTRR